MRPSLWQPPVELSMQEEQIMKRIRKAKLFVFLRQHRHELFDEAFQQELAGLYRNAERGQPPVAPALLALAVNDHKNWVSGTFGGPESGKR